MAVFLTTYHLLPGYNGAEHPLPGLRSKSTSGSSRGSVISGDVESKTIRVAYDAFDTSPYAIEAAVTRLGHRVEKRSA